MPFTRSQTGFSFLDAECAAGVTDLDSGAHDDTGAASSVVIAQV